MNDKGLTEFQLLALAVILSVAVVVLILLFTDNI